MPEGDSVFRAAARMRAALVGRTVLLSDVRVPRYATTDLRGQTVTAFESVGKHMLTRFSGGWTLHTHFRMDGSWSLTTEKDLPRRLAPDVRVRLVTDGPTAWALRMPVVEVLPTEREADAVGHLGPDLLGPGWDPDVAVARLAADPSRPLLQALLDQRNLAGLGNLWAVELCFLRGRSPWTPVGEVDLPPAVHLAHRMLRHSVEHRTAMTTTGDTRRGRTHWVYGRYRRPCLRCGTPVAFAPGDGTGAFRETWWCPYCQPGPPPPASTLRGRL